MSSNAFALGGKSALVVGANNVVGCAVATALAEAGADVVVATSTPSAQEEAAVQLCISQVHALGRKGFAHTLDATNEREVGELVQRTVAELGRLDILVNAQDLAFAKPTAETTLHEWRRVLDVNLTIPYLTCRAAAGAMQAQGAGRIINIVSLLGERGMANGAAYCAAQGGVLNLTRAVALEWARSGITVNAIGAGWTEGMGFMANEALQQQLLRYIPSRRLAQPEDIAATAVYLASDMTGFVTGQVIWVDGGMRTRL